jgi:DNA-binding beta-propeller fold protein YncE
MKFIRLFALCLLSIFVAQSSLSQEKIIILNEGNWQSDNGTMSYFENGKIISNKWFKEKNGKKLGDTPNDIIQINDNLLAIAINWSNIVQFITPEGKAVAATEDIPNNRKLASDGKYLYVSSYGHECATVNGKVEFKKGFVAKIDLSTFKVVQTCEVGYEPEGIAYYKGYLFVANTGGYAFTEDHEYETTVSILDAETMKKVRDVDTHKINLYGKMSRSGQYLCINSPGDYYYVDAASIIFDCDAALKGSNNCFVVLDRACTYNCPTKDGRFITIGSRFSYITYEYKFYYAIIDPAVVMDTNGAVGVDETLPGTILSDIKKMTMPYAIYVNPYTGYIYGTDAATYVEGGTLYQWSPEGKLLGTHTLYINPGHILALPPDGKFNGVDDVLQDKVITDDTMYNLQGIKVQNPQRGQIYIQNGKKILYK